jgi:endonuclease/exonuclease/phosphatase family metal-dependent hydrolase
VEARKESSKLLLQKIKDIAGNNPVIFTGDLNGSHSSDPYLLIANSGFLKDSYKEVKYPYANNASFNGFSSSRNRTDIIDHIFITNHFSANRWGILTDTYHGKYPSDHFPVVAKINFK